MKIGRNDTCFCGSGKKFKQCCEGKATEKANVFTKWAAVIFGSLLLIGTLALMSSIATNDEPVTPGRVWSPEHQHWH